MEMFTWERISPHMTRIRDLTHTAMYLVEGENIACLIDTGSGIGTLRMVIEQLTDKPYFVILTHGHVDHAGGAGEFSDKEVYLHPLDKELMEVHCKARVQLDYLAFTNPSANVQREQLVVPLELNKVRPLRDEQIFDLGGLSLEILHTPGHTQGMCMVLVREERIILFGDGCGVSVLLLDEYASTVEQYMETLLRLKGRELEYDFILRNHGTCESKKCLLDGVIECCRCILAGTDDHFPAEHLPVQVEKAYFAKAIAGNPPKRLDGGEGNIVYTPSKIR